MPTGYTGSDDWVIEYDIPIDGEVPDVASVNVALEALGDRTTWLAARLLNHTGGFDTAAFGDTEETYSTGAVSDSAAVRAIATGCEVGDQILCLCMTNARITSGGARVGYFHLVASDNSSVTSGSPSTIGGARQRITPDNDTEVVPIILIGRHTVGTAGPCTVNLRLQRQSGTDLILETGGSIILVKFRPTP